MMKHLSLRIDQDLLHKLHYMAKYDDRSANGQVLFYIRQAVTEFEARVEKIPPRPEESDES